ncbi:hypothetical protein NQD34_007454 [Periophthalmus magnuspinnatus]|nr:hypothetical protein NQD34_007454 [Periophthalmus magnuspinnatus]
MFPSSGLFAHIDCSLFEGALCERPHCVFKHVNEDQKRPIFVTLCDILCCHSQSLILFVVAASEEAADECLQELERINREIESVKHQVEEEQRKLSHYQINQASERSNSYNPQVMSKNVAQSCYSSHTSPSAPHSKPKKYILDSSKPRTDLEYDPLSNFSSDLRSYCSSNREQKTRREQVTLNQRKRNVLVPPPPKQSPEHSDSNEEDILIIDLSASPDKTKDDTKTASDMTAANTSGKIKTLEQSVNPLNSVSSKNVTSNNSIPDEENIFVKMTQHLSNYNNLTPPQPCEQKNTVQDRNANANTFPVNKTPTSQIQKTETPGKNVATADSPNLPNEKKREIQEQKQPTAPKQPQMVFVGSLCEPQDILSAAKLTSNIEMLSAVSDQPIPPKKEDVILIDSSSEDELNYSDLDVSESDPDEECYRIFMEANGEDPNPDLNPKSSKPPPEFVNLPSPAVPGKKRVAHEARYPVAKVRPQPQVLVPLRAPVSSSPPVPAPPVICKVEQRRSVLTASIKAGQASMSRGHPEAQRAQTSPCPVPPKPASYVSYIPLGATVIDVGNNLHLVLPEGTFPVSNSSGQVTSVLTPITTVNTDQVTSVLTPITPVNTHSVTIRQACHPSAPTQQRRTSQPVIIPPLARRPVMATTSTNQCSSTPASVVKPVATKRKLKQQCETVKVPHDIRQSYVNKFTEEFFKTTGNVHEAFEKALAEEKAVYNRSMNKLKYLSIAVNALKKLRNQSCGAAEENNQTNKKTKGSIPLNPSLLNGKGMIMLYECLKDYVLTEEMLIEKNFPLQNPEKNGSAILFSDNKKSILDPLRKLCCRCGATYSVSQTGKHTRKEECTYHYGKGVENKVPGGVETRYSCCQGVMGSPGCQVFKLHVCNSLSMDGFVSTAPRDPADKSCPGVFSLNCEMCYTIHGLELLRVTVVNTSLQIVYDTFVRPNNEVIDYNTRFSGISPEDVEGHSQSLKKVQDTLLSFISADTILIGHSLETDLCVLKLLHGTVVDTSVVFPHRLGPPHKLSLHSLTAEYLRKIIQETVCGHDTAEDAVACMELMIWKAKEDGKLKKIQ